MNLISYRHAGKPCFGAVVNDDVVELSGRLDGVADLAALLGNTAALARARELVASAAASYPLAGVQLEPVIPKPGKVVCVGINYAEHAHEAGRKIGQHPVIFQRYHETLIADGAALLRPRASEQFDFEAELAVVIGKEGRPWQRLVDVFHGPGRQPDRNVCRHAVLFAAAMPRAARPVAAGRRHSRRHGSDVPAPARLPDARRLDSENPRADTAATGLSGVPNKTGDRNGL